MGNAPFLKEIGDQSLIMHILTYPGGDGFVYKFFYKGPIKDAVKIVDSLKNVE